jgi:hypothetical protein
MSPISLSILPFSDILKQQIQEMLLDIATEVLNCDSSGCNY